MRYLTGTLLAAAGVVALAAPVIAQGSAASAPAPAAGAPADAPPLIARDKLFGNPSRTAGRISPDGRWLSWIAPRDGVLNIWVAPASDPQAARALTNEKARPIRSYNWSPDARQILFVNDKGGDENFLLYGVDVATGRQTTLTPFEKTRAMIVGTSNRIKDRVLVGLNNRDPRYHDVHSLDLKTGKLTLVQQNDGYAGFVADNDLKLRIAAKPDAEGGVDYHRMTDGKIEAEPFARIGLDDALTTSPVGFSADGRTLYWIDSRGRDTAALLAQDVATGRTRPLAQDARADIGGVLVDPRTFAVQAYRADYLKPEWKPLDRAIGADLRFLEQRLGAPPIVTSQTDDNSRWTVAVDPVVRPSETWLFDRRGRKLTQLFVSRPELAGAPLVPMHGVEIRTRDGLTLPSYLTLPAGADANRDGRADRPAPLVLLVHGGPQARDQYGYNGSHQWLANRGYAVMSVNYRGSTGFGKRFISAGNREWAGKMHDDLIDAVDWAVRQGVTTPDKVAIMGGSYGGYATLVGLTFTPDKFRCGVSIVGPSNLFTLIQSIPAYWEAGKRQLYARVGDPATAEGRALLEARSPLGRADRITKPLLIGQGANDPRVKQAESDQIVDAMKAKGIPVTYVLFPDEGHGFARPVNNIAFNAVAENFLQSCLGGRAEPIGGAVKASTAQVLHGAEFAPGLREALASK
ncbi:MAG: Dipeptidyl anminopeptidase [uncultured Sphingomonadaceae bacterium]|uniref:Dipeptidyl anminopeptidase n=1 Tax=uncultured Sphingomonadaceae bacterium TaxID=169976 RepID=A0A6J4SGW2_9SPHN|nr:MAG: Dipeptidyl anminopeptidase [uncultured Sphingomonadaceae bacterium]